MPIRVVCPNGHALRVKEKLAGRDGTCPTCGAGFLVPPLAETPAPPPPSEGTPVTQAAEPTPPDQPPPLPSTPAASAEPAEDAVEWRVAQPDGQQFGPTVPTIFAQWIRAGRVRADSLVWRSGWNAWKPAAEVAQDLPAPLATAAVDPAALPEPELPAGLTLPPNSQEPPESTETPVHATQAAKPRATGAGSYALRKKRQARRRRYYTIALAVACLALIAMLVWLLMAGPPAGAPVVPVPRS